MADEKELISVSEDPKNRCYENFKDFNEMMHRHLLETSDKVVGYGQTAAAECRETIKLLHGNCIEYTDKLNEILKDNKDLVEPTVKAISATVSVGILGVTAMFVAHSMGHKEKYNLRKGKIKITDR